LKLPITRLAAISDISLIFVIIYMLLWTVLCALYIFPFVKSLIVAKPINKIKKSVLEKLYVFLAFSLVLLSLVLDIGVFVIPFICVALLLFTLTIYLKEIQIIAFKNIKLKHKLIYIILFIFAVTITYISRPVIINTAKFNWILLADSSKKYIVLPLSLRVDSRTRFNDLLVPKSNTILIDDIMVMSKSHSKIVNKPIAEFTQPSNFLVLSPDKETYINVLPKLQDIAYLFRSNNTTSYFSISDANSSDVSIVLIFDCSAGVRDSTITMNSYPLYSVNPYKNVTSKRVLNFPGCNKEPNLNTVTYEVPLPKAFRIGDGFLFELVDFKQNGIIDYKLKANNKFLDISNYKDPQTGGVLADFSINTQADTPLTVFSFTNTKSLEFNRNGDSINLAKIINDLIKRNIIKSSFTIRSLEDFAAIKLDNSDY
jgi:hypothetical protein